MKRRTIRTDDLLVLRGLVPDLREARASIMAGEVCVGQERIRKASDRVPEDSRLSLKRKRFSSRAGAKLDEAFTVFAIDVADRRALDIGASTGGFTSCLLARGVAKVTAIDVGKGLMDDKLLADPRLVLLEGVNARFLKPQDLDAPFDLVVADVSFISLRKILPVIPPLLVGASSDVVLLVKPQFELPRRLVARGGVVRDGDLRRQSVDRVVEAATAVGFECRELLPSSIKGARGNQEFLLHLRLAAEI